MKSIEKIATRVVLASLINGKSVGMYLAYLMQGKDSLADSLLRKMIPFNEARAKFESMVKEKYISPNFDAAKKKEYAKRSISEMNAILDKNSSVVEKFMKYAQRLVQEADDPEGATFNGEDIESIKDPKGGKVTYKFHTGAGSVYVMTDKQMSRRVKSEQGKGDTGLHDWHEMILFAKNDCSGSFDSGEVRKIEDAIANKRMDDDALKPFGDVSLVPKIGYYVFEIKKLGERRPTYHPGHEVARIDWKR